MISVLRFVIDARYVRDRPSGIGMYVRELVDRMPAIAPDVQFRFWTHPERPRISASDNVSHHTVRATGDGFRTMFAPSLLDSLAGDDVVHFPFNLLGRGIRCASVVTIHDLMWLEQPELVDGRPFVRRVRQRYYQAGMRNAMRSATKLICVSQATADRVIAVTPAAKDRIVVTHNAVSDAFRPPRNRDTSRQNAATVVGSSDPYFLVVGKNEPYKAHDVAVRAFAAARKGRERLVLVQRDHAGRGISRLVRELNIADRVTWSPNLSHLELVDVIRNARALIQPSIVEGFGIPVLEAMACGCPVITSDTAALVEVVGGAGLHAPIGDVAAFAAHIGSLRDASLCADLTERGLARAQDFDWTATAKKTVEVYREARRLGPRC